MKPTLKLIFLSLILSGLWSCNGESADNSEENSDTLTISAQEDTLDTSIDELDQESALVESESEVSQEEEDDDSSPFHWLSDDLFKDMSINQKEISKSDFKKHVDNYKPSCAINKDHLIKGKGLEVYFDCDPPACLTGIVEEKNREGKRLMLATRFEDGEVMMRMSPSCNRFITFFSFLSFFESEPDLDNYGSELFTYKLTKDAGLKSIVPSLKHYIKDWLIDDLVWIDDNSVAVKTYTQKSYRESDFDEYTYFELTLEK